MDRLLGGIVAPEEIGKPVDAGGATPAYRGFIPGLTALRALGVTVVVLNHAWPWKAYALEMGWILMDCFFVMSGFFIGGILLDTRSRPDYFLSFYVRRALRILPLYYLVLGTLTLVAALVDDPGYAAMLVEWGSPLWFFFYMGNIPTAISDLWPAAAEWALTPLWSLQIEEQFYLLFPLLVHRLRPRTLARVLLVLIVTSLGVRLGIWVWNPVLELGPYVLLPCRMEGLALGALLALRFRAGPWTVPRARLTWLTAAWLGVTVVSAVLGGYEHKMPFIRTFGFFLSSVASAYLVLWLVTFRESRATAWLALAPLQHVGKVSYGMYVIHWPLMYALWEAYAMLDAEWIETSYLHTVLVYFGTLACASLSWWLMEGPLLRARGRWITARGAVSARAE